MSEIFKDIICLVGVSFLFYRVYNLMALAVKIFTDSNDAESGDILHGRG